MEKAKWKATRDAEVEKELARIEADRGVKRKKIVPDQPSGTENRQLGKEPQKRNG